MSYLSANKKGKSESYWNIYIVVEFTKADAEPSRTTKIEHFVEIVKSFEPLTSFAENSILEMYDWVMNTALVLSQSY